MRKVILVFFSLYTLAFSLYSAFLDTGAGARGVAMANSFSVSGGDVYSLYYNPAGLSYIKMAEFSTNLTQFYMGLKDNSNIGEYFIGSCLRLENKGAVGIGLKSLRVDSLYRENVYYLGWGGDFSKEFGFPVSLGGTFKIFYHRYGTTDYSYNSLINIGDTYTGTTGGLDPVFEKGFSKEAFSFDFGIISKLSSKFRLGLNFRDILTPDVGIKEKDIVPFSFDAGFSFLDNGFMFNFVFHREKNENDLRTGLEKWFNKKFALRSGIEIGTSELLLLNFGFGWVEKEIISIDYSFTMSAGIMENYGTHRLSISYRWGKPVESKVAKKKEKIEVKVISEKYKEHIRELRNKRRNQLLKEYLKGVGAMKRGEYNDAMKYLQWVVIFEVENEIKNDSEILKIKEKANKKIEEIKSKVKKSETKKEKLKKEKMRKHFMKGQEFYIKGKYKEAIKEWKKVLELDPNHKLSKIKIEKAKKKLEESK